MRVLNRLDISGSLGLGSSSKDTFKIGSANLENSDILTDNLEVWANTDFKNDVTLGSSSVDTIYVSGTLKNEGGAQLTGSYKGVGTQLTNLTASNIDNFTNDVRSKFSAGENIGITTGIAGGIISATTQTSGNLSGNGTSASPATLKDNINLTSVSASFSGSGALINDITASNINNFSADTRKQISGTGVITYDPVTGIITYTGAGGDIYTSGNITGSGTALNPITMKDAITASVGVSASYFYGDGSNLTGLPNPDLSPYATSTGVSASFTTPTQVSGAISGSDRPTRAEVTGALSPYLLSSTAASTYATLAGVTSSFTTPTQVSGAISGSDRPTRTEVTGVLGGYAKLDAINTFSAASNVFNNDVTINGTASIAMLNTVNQQSLVVGDKYITIMSGSSTHGQLDGAGILFGSASSDITSGDQNSVAHIVYRKGNYPTDVISDYIEVYPQLRSAGVISGSNLTGSNTGDETTATIKTKLGAASSLQDGYLTQADWNTFNNKQNAITLTTTGTTGSATLVGSTLNIPNYIPLIPPLSANEIPRGYTFQNSSNAIVTVNTTITPTAIDLAPVSTAVASTNALTRQIRAEYQGSSAATDQAVGFFVNGDKNYYISGSGFRFVAGFGASDNNNCPDAGMFIGLTTSSITPESVNGWSSNAHTIAGARNIIGIGCDGGDANLSIIHNDATNNATKVDLGSSFVANPGGGNFNDFFQVELYNAVNSTVVHYRVKSLKNNVEVSGTLSTDLPATTVGLGVIAFRTSAGSSVAPRLCLSRVMVYSQS